MTKVAQLALPDELPKTYLELVQLHTPRPIRDAVSHANTVEVVDALAGFRLNKDQEDYLEILSQLIEAYEEDNLKAQRKISGIELVRYLLDENDMTGDDFAKLLNIDRSVAYKILKGARSLTAEHIRKISERFLISADALLV